MLNTPGCRRTGFQAAGQARTTHLCGGHGSAGDRGCVTHPGIGQDPGQPRNTAWGNSFRALVRAGSTTQPRSCVKLRGPRSTRLLADGLTRHPGAPFGDLSLAIFNGYYPFILAAVGGDVMVARFDRSPGTDPSLATGSGLIGRGGKTRQQLRRSIPRRVDKRVTPPERTNS